ncbi:MAG: T9SS type A sorting domain-containing protein [Bacteroidetes bacterium]|nr:T9SS type A sorting domain-containing protein [Bacteroidota bacterium]MBK9414928.1 T9SS type A sorting domain-containing protein [Bacteroidota bacterium]MBP6428578.1 T9SS type A sorting domain-containing protein [Bacteroidia bacterium]MBP6658490.1 T9SS type A sorting domain-containing protein [Bacteroidia bacterium]
MRKIILIIFLSFSFQSANATFDSLRVAICSDNGDNCFGSPSLSKTVEHFDSIGNVIAVEYYIVNGCDGTWHHEDYSIVLGTISQYNSDNRIMSFVNNYYTDTVISRQTTTLYAYDSNGNRISTRSFSTLPAPQEIGLDSVAYDVNGDQIYFLTGKYNIASMLFDTSQVEERVFFMPGKLLSSTIRNFSVISQPLTYYKSNWYDSNNNLIYSVDSVSDHRRPSRNYFVYDSLDRDIETWYQVFDSISMDWISNFRSVSLYDTSSRRIEVNYYRCPDSTCTDTSSRIFYSYDSADRMIGYQSESYDGPGWQGEGGSTSSYDISGNLISNSSWTHVEVGCSYSNSTTNTYNSSYQLIHSEYEYLGCNYNYGICDYFNLNEDSLFVEIANQGDVCENDTVRFLVTANGGQSPLTFHWSPGNMVSDSTILSPIIFADTISNTNFILTVTDANGLSKSSSVELIAQSIPSVTLGNDTIICVGSTIILDPGIYEDYLWQNMSANRLYYASSSVPDTLLYTVNVRGQNFCWNSDSVVVIFDICAAITEGISVNQNYIFPNPAKEFLTVHLDEFKSEETVYFSVSDQLGRVVLNKQLFSDSEKIDFKGIGKGIYSYSIFTSERKLDHGKLVLVD